MVRAAWRALGPAVVALVLAVLLALVPGCAAHFSDLLGDPNLRKFLLNDYYGALGIGASASKDEVKKAYRALSRKYHPDRNPDAPAHLILDVMEAYEVLKNEESRASYDKFLAEVPPQFRPRYGKRLINPAVVLAGAFFLFVSLISCAQCAQFGRERRRALESEFFAQAAEAAEAKGRSQEDFLRSFLLANPELERTWRDSLGGLLLLLPVRLVFGKRAPTAAELELESQRQADVAAITGSGSSSDEEDEVEELVLPEIPEDASPEEKKALLKQRRKLTKKHADRVAAAEKQRAARRKSKAAEKQRDALREEQRANKEAERERLRQVEDARNHERALALREAVIKDMLNAELLLRMIEDGYDNLAPLFTEAGIIKAEPESAEEREPVLELATAKLHALVRTDDLDQVTFWQQVFDTNVLDWQDEQREAAEAEQEAYEAEQRRKVRALNGEGDSGDDDDHDRDASPAPAAAAAAADQEADDEWGKELAAKEAAKQAKKAAAKCKKKTQAEANKQANQDSKANKAKSGGKKDKRRR